MSLILDALKKSEQERRRERVPDLQSIHQSMPLRTHASGRKWGWVIFALSLNAAAIAGWWWQQNAITDVVRKPPAQVDAQKKNAQQIVASGVEAVATPAAGLQVQNTQASAQESEFTRIEPRPIASTARDVAAPIEEFDELGPDIRSALPAMTFSFHVYSADPRNRTIIINNQRMREGDPVSNGVVLERITEDGVILAMDHHRIHVNVLTGW
jgi:general secretion pathway protein B